MCEADLRPNRISKMRCLLAVRCQIPCTCFCLLEFQAPVATWRCVAMMLVAAAGSKRSVRRSPWVPSAGPMLRVGALFRTESLPSKLGHRTVSLHLWTSRDFEVPPRSCVMRKPHSPQGSSSEISTFTVLQVPTVKQVWNPLL